MEPCWLWKISIQRLVTDYIKQSWLKFPTRTDQANGLIDFGLGGMATLAKPAAAKVEKEDEAPTPEVPAVQQSTPTPVWTFPPGYTGTYGPALYYVQQAQNLFSEFRNLWQQIPVSSYPSGGPLYVNPADHAEVLKLDGEILRDLKVMAELVALLQENSGRHRSVAGFTSRLDAILSQVESEHSDEMVSLARGITDSHEKLSGMLNEMHGQLQAHAQKLAQTIQSKLVTVQPAPIVGGRLLQSLPQVTWSLQQPVAGTALGVYPFSPSNLQVLGIQGPGVVSLSPGASMFGQAAAMPLTQIGGDMIVVEGADGKKYLAQIIAPYVEAVPVALRAMSFLSLAMPTLSALPEVIVADAESEDTEAGSCTDCD